MEAVKKKSRSQEERRAESERRIIEEAIELYSTKGYHRTSLIEVGTAAGYTGTLVSQRFGSKQGLLQSVLEHIIKSFKEERLDSLSLATSPRDALRRYIETYLEEIRSRKGRLRPLYVLMGEALGGTPEALTQLAQHDDVLRARFVQIIKDGQATGEFNKNLNVPSASIAIVALLRGVTMQSLIKPEAIDISAVKATLFDAVDALLQP
ncbi:TetR family transcriptional regulator [Rhizobium sp. S152]|uniref:TetR/AcrR family transcriptional regulator n=1 Tax=Rhizobium sp. S152 TaxID=3055038 RepID=UPI0025A9F4CE|nr:TetR family transcriptional regulator [Rhizobium sp. S152]MDM9624733.1 TetR family transcriptional regulator [Rhizobium sp. S152]